MNSSIVSRGTRPAAASLILVGAALLAACGTGGPSNDASSWDESVAYAASLVPQLENLEYERAPLIGDAQPGAAFEGYDRGLELLLPAEDPGAPSETELTNILMLGLEGRIDGSSPRAESHATAVEEFLHLPRVQLALAALQRGARRSNAAPSFDWASSTADLDRVIAYRLLNLTAFVQADVLVASGKQIEAAQLRIDAAQMGVDQLRTPVLTHASMGLANVVTAFLGPFGSVAGPGTGLDHLNPDARRLLLDALGEVLPKIELNPLAAEGQFVLMLRHVEIFDRLPRRYSLPADGALERPEIVARLETQRERCRSGQAEAAVLESFSVVRQRLARLQLALRVDLEEHAAHSCTVEGRTIVAEVTAEEIIVTFADAGASDATSRPFVLRRSSQR